MLPLIGGAFLYGGMIAAIMAVSGGSSNSDSDSDGPAVVNAKRPRSKRRLPKKARGSWVSRYMPRWSVPLTNRLSYKQEYAIFKTKSKGAHLTKNGTFDGKHFRFYEVSGSNMMPMIRQDALRLESGAMRRTALVAIEARLNAREAGYRGEAGRFVQGDALDQLWVTERASMEAQFIDELEDDLAEWEEAVQEEIDDADYTSPAFCTPTKKPRKDDDDGDDGDSGGNSGGGEGGGTGVGGVLGASLVA